MAACTYPSLPQEASQEFREFLASRPLGADDHLLVGAGDIARCNAELTNAVATGKIITTVLNQYPDKVKVFTAGDHAYERGTADEFEQCYAHTWGAFNHYTLPVPGNHDYQTDQGAPYFAYFDYYRQHPGAAVRRYYSDDLGYWHIVALNSNLDSAAMEAQARWLDDDLARASQSGRCTLAIWHHPLFSSGRHGQQGNDPGRAVEALWRPLLQQRAELIVNGHDHLYERFAPQDEAGRASRGGIREFVVGTGGANLYSFYGARPNSEVRDNAHHGVLVLILHPDSYEWAFVATDGRLYDRSSAPVPCQ